MNSKDIPKENDNIELTSETLLFILSGYFLSGLLFLSGLGGSITLVVMGIVCNFMVALIAACMELLGKHHFSKQPIRIVLWISSLSLSGTLAWDCLLSAAGLPRILGLIPFPTYKTLEFFLGIHVACICLQLVFMWFGRFPSGVVSRLLPLVCLVLSTSYTLMIYYWILAAY